MRFSAPNDLTAFMGVPSGLWGEVGFSGFFIGTLAPTVPPSKTCSLVDLNKLARPSIDRLLSATYK
jgi:hypothetical protein